VQEIGALRGELASVSTAKSAAEASLASATVEVERLKKSEVERKKELIRLNKQVEQLSAAKSELEQRLRDRESASVRVVCMYDVR
jgi:predicted  nucleic acid-binding Zn-ribbon protein